MPTMDLKGDFTYVTTALSITQKSTLGSFGSGTAILTNRDNASRNTAANFEGSFNHTTNSGSINTVGLELVDLTSIKFLLDVEFTGFSTSFSSVFNVSGGAFSYSEFGWLPSVTRGDFTVNGSDDDDVFQATGEFSFSGADTILAGRGDDRIDGESGADRLFGQAGDDILVGGAGKDILKGGNGADRLDGEGGADKMAGGKGRDVFVFGDNGRDKVTDFQNRKDKIELENGTDFGSVTVETHAKGTLVTVGNAEMLLLGVSEDVIGANDFLF